MTNPNGEEEHTLHDPISYEKIKICSDYILANSSHRPKVGIICGSGLDPLIGGLADLATRPDIFPYEDIPGFPRSTVTGDVGRLLLGELNGIPVVIMQGRFQSYDGYELWMTALPVRVMRLIGVESLLVTNAGGGLNNMFTVRQG